MHPAEYASNTQTISFSWFSDTMDVEDRESVLCGVQNKYTLGFIKHPIILSILTHNGDSRNRDGIGK
jgi:hypothetical protein